MTRLRPLFYAGFLLLIPLFAGLSALGRETGFEDRTLHGWRVVVETALIEDPDLFNPMLERLDVQLSEIATKVPAPQLVVLQETPIWLVRSDTYAERQGLLGLYFFSTDWLAQNGYPPELHQAIQFNGNFGREPSQNIVFHELAHAFHDRALGLDNPEIIALYNAAQEAAKGARDRCPREGGTYAFSNVDEFFATFSQAYFGGTCAYPNNRNVIRLRHPEVFSYLQTVWGF